MYRLHDKTRRRVCLAAFFALCVVPTAIVLCLGVSRRLPGRARAEAQRLSWQMGLDVSIRDVEHPRPGLVRYEGIELRNPETKRLVVRCRRLEATRNTATDERGRRRFVLMLTASEVEIEAAELNGIWNLLQRVLAQPAGFSQGNVQMTAGEVSLRSNETSETLTDVRGTIETSPATAQADLGFRLDGPGAAEPVQIRICRNRQTEPPTTSWGLYTGGGPLPCDLLASGLPAFEAAGSGSRFCGYFWVTETPGGPSGELIGQFTELDLEALSAGRLAHTLRGSAQLTIQKARFRAGRVEAATGSLVAGPGVISRSLLDAAADRLRMIRGAEVGPLDDLVRYDRLGLDFQLDPSGLTLRGERLPSGSGAILVGRQGLLLSEPMFQPLPVAALVPVLVPASAVEVPASRHAEWLLRRLPIPDAFPPRVAGASSRHDDAPVASGTAER